MRIRTSWVWHWGIDQNNIQIHSADHVFSDFNEMKEFSSQHSFEHQWIGDGYWSDYDKVETPYDEVAEAEEQLARIFGKETWIELFDNEYDKVLAFCEPLYPISTNSSLHIYEEIYHVGDTKYRFLYAIGDRQNPTIEKVKIN